MLRAILHRIHLNLQWRKCIYMENLQEDLPWDFFPLFFLLLWRYLVTITTQGIVKCMLRVLDFCGVFFSFFCCLYLKVYYM